jgi:agmatine deiminase
MKNFFHILTVVFFCTVTTVFSQQLSEQELLRGRWLSQKEYALRGSIQPHQPSVAPEGPVQPVAEFEPMQGVLIAYPFGIPMELIVEMSEEVVVTTIVSSSGQANSVSNIYEANGVYMSNVDFLVEPHDTYWTRDYGPWFIREEDQISIVNFTYNRPRPDDDVMPINMAEMLDIPYYNMPVIHTGGNYMCDGFGIAAQTELVYEENSISDSQVDQYMEDYLGVTDNFVIDDPLGDYIKHIDCWAKFLDVDKVLVAEVPQSDPRYDDYEAAANYFASRNCAYGYPFEVIRVFAPGSFPYTPYSNSLILNDKVFLPVTGSQWDDDAIATYQEAMPGYEIIPIEEGNQDWLNTDALHCRTHEIADLGMLKISHIPFHGELEFTGEAYIVNAQIHAYSNAALYPDSLLMYYKLNDEAYQEVVLQANGQEIYTAEIWASPGDEVSYYLHAADESGRSENLPYVGSADPFVFSINLVEELLNLKPDTVYLSEEEPKFTLKNIGTNSVVLTDIYENESSQAFPVWWIDYMDPEIEFPYTLQANDSIEIFLDNVIFREIFYDSLIVTTANNLYHGIVAVDIIGLNEYENNTSFSITPNPFTNKGHIRLLLEEAENVSIDIYQINGQFVHRLENNKLGSGEHTYTFDASTNNNTENHRGVYIVKVKIGDKVFVQKWVKT